MIKTAFNSQEIIKKDRDILKSRKISELMTVSEKKDLIQSYSLELSEKHNHLVLSWATGCGKSLAALKIIKDRIDSGDTTKWYIVCKETNHITNWIADIAKHKLSHIMDYVEIFCYASLHKYKDTKANLILDESHAVSNLRQEILKTIDHNIIISLSATLNLERKTQLDEIKQIREFVITIDDAINYGILPPPKIYVIHSKLDNKNVKYTYRKKKSVKKKNLNNSIPQFTIHYRNYYQFLKENVTTPAYVVDILCTEQEYYDLLTSDMDFRKKTYMSTKLLHHKNLFLNTGSRRKEFISKTKSDILNELIFINAKNNMRFITFTGSIEQCDEYKDMAIHSKIPKKIRDKRIKEFNNKERSALVAVDMLREGMNLEDIESGIITQLDSEELSFVQMMGRVFRSENPILFVIVMDKTQDITYLKKCVGGLDNKFLTYVEYNSKNMTTLSNLLWEKQQNKKGKRSDTDQRTSTELEKTVQN